MIGIQKNYGLIEKNTNHYNGNKIWKKIATITMTDVLTKHIAANPAPQD